MKGMFLFTKSPAAPKELDYHFEPYDYGPFTTEVYRDLEKLHSQGLVTRIGRRAYRISEAGERHIDTLTFSEISDKELQDIRSSLDQLKFRDLLRMVYSEHPEYSARSIARDVLEGETRH